MKILGEELGVVGRSYIALPPLLLIGFLVGLFLLAAAGQARLDAADQRVHASEARAQALNEFVALITNAESEQRGYLLSGEDAYARAYSSAAAQVGPALERLAAAYASTGAAGDLTRLRVASQMTLRQLERSLASNRPRDSAPSVDTTGTLMSIVTGLRARENVESATATAEWRSSLRILRGITTGGAILNIALVVLATVIVYGDMRRRARQATDLRDQKRELARLVEERTRDLTALSTHLQGVSEQEKSALSRELHDELGGLLVAARMDLSWLQQRLPTTDPAIEQRFRRIHESLSAGVDLKRRVVEELRPTLLDNMGLFTALRWQFKESCRRNGLNCSETIPDTELKFSPDASIGVFRVAQEALTNILKHADADSADLTIDIQDDMFLLQISDDGRGILPNRLQTNTSHGLASMRHRIAALGGNWEVQSPATGGTVVTARIPLMSMLVSESAQPADA